MANLNNAFEMAEKYLDIPKMLDAEGELECLNLTCLPIRDLQKLDPLMVV